MWASLRDIRVSQIPSSLTAPGSQRATLPSGPGLQQACGIHSLPTQLSPRYKFSLSSSPLYPGHNPHTLMSPHWRPQTHTFPCLSSGRGLCFPTLDPQPLEKVCF